MPDLQPAPLVAVTALGAGVLIVDISDDSALGASIDQMGLSSSLLFLGAGESSFVGARISSTPESSNQFARNMFGRVLIHA